MTGELDDHSSETSNRGPKRPDIDYGPYNEIVSEGIFTLDAERCICDFLSEKVLQITGWDREELRERGLFGGKIHRDDVHELKGTIETVCRSGRSREMDARINIPDGSYKWIRLQLKAVPNGRGEVRTVMGSIRDIETLHRVKRAADLYLDLMTHDLTNRHQVILMNLEMLDGTRKDEESYNRYFSSVMKNLDRAMDTIRSVKIMADVGIAKIEGQPVDLISAVRTGILNASETHAFPKAKVEFDPPGSPIFVSADSRIDLIFNHLVSNSLVHTNKEKPRVKVEVREDGEFASVSVIDDGPGIPEDIRRSITEGRVIDVENAKGRGLGLTLVKSLVEAYDGTLELNEAAGSDPDHGTSVSIKLPKYDLS